MEELREKLVRPAVLFEPALGDFEEEPESYFGKVSVAAEGEGWPEYDGLPMIPLLQLNLNELVYRPAGSEDLRFLSLFVAGGRHPESEPNGSSWVLRTYSTLSGLVPLKPPSSRFEVRAVRLGPPALVEDYPCYEDLEEEVEDALWDAFAERYPTLPGIKLGGWPSLIQSEVYWAPFNRHAADPRYVLQVDSLPEANWQWGQGGCAYLGRGTSKGHTDEWALEWQCF